LLARGASFFVGLETITKSLDADRIAATPVSFVDSISLDDSSILSTA
jgi:hypothetical protein